jgi:sulfate adenylyltransferase (ADP) / ATP adenylyltransferase
MSGTSEPGTLSERLVEVGESALRTGVLEPIATRSVLIEDAGVRFLVRVLERIDKKHAARDAQLKEGTDPFLPYDESLFVADVSKTHVAILNKFNVLDHHLLVVTREFEEQESLLTEGDFEAMWTVLPEFPSLFFYNAGPEAGASQRHKHLQLVPLPLGAASLSTERGPGREHPPMETMMTDSRVGELPFQGRLARLDDLAQRTPGEAARPTRERYLEALGAIGRASSPCAYNLLATMEWMFLVPRSQPSYREIPVNALGFAGAMLVPDERRLAALSEVGPMTVWKEVTQ